MDNLREPQTDSAIIETPDVEGHQPGIATQVVPAWLISFAAHAAIGLVFSAFVFQRINEYPPVITEFRPMQPAPEMPKPPKDPIADIQDVPMVVVETETYDKEKPIVLEASDVLEVNVEVQEELSQGRQDALASSEFGNSGAFMTIGVGGGAAGQAGDPYAQRRDPRKGTRVNRPPRGAVDGVDAALRWFKKHQSANGMWDSVNYYQNCEGESKCERGGSHDKSDANIAATAFALRCFLGNGHDHRTPSKYRPVVEKGLAWLMEQQRSNGLWGNRNYEHAVATMAVAEAYGMTQDGALRAPAQSGVNYLLAKQNRDGTGSGGLGWDYVEPTGRNDSSVTGWCVMALKSAAMSGLDVKGGLEGSRAWLKATYELANPNHAQIDPYNGVAEFGYAWKNGTWDGEQRGNRSPLGALCAVFLGHSGDSPIASTLVNYAMKNQMPATYPCNTYYLYYNTLAVFQAGGEAWKKWYETPMTMLVKSQRRDSCYDGSWDFAGTEFHGHDMGRVFSTALCCLSLEVFWLYDRVYDKKPATHGGWR